MSPQTAPGGSSESENPVWEKLNELVRRANYSRNNCALQPGVLVPCKQEFFSLAHSMHPGKRQIQVVRAGGKWVKN